MPQRIKSIFARYAARRKWVYAAAIGTFASLLIVAGFFLFGSGKSKDSPVLKIMPENVDLQVKDVHFTEVGDPDSTWDIKAETAHYKKKENLAMFEKVQITMIRPDGRTFSMSGDHGQVNTQTRDAEIFGNVVLSSNRGDRISTDKVVYSGKEKKASTDDRIVFTRPGLNLKGKGMVFFVDKQHVQLLSEIKAVVTKQ